MRWYEYKMEVDDLHASDDLKAKLLAMQPAEEAPKPARKPKKAIHFPRKTLSIAACGLLCGVGLYAAVHSPFSLLPAGGAALSSAPETASYAAAYSMDDVNSALAAPKMAVQAGGSADAMSDRDAGGTGTLSAEAAQTSTKLIYTANLTIESKDFDAARQAITPASALIQLLHGINELGDVCSRIDGIQPGYAARSALTGVTQLTPVWQVNTDTVVYQLDLVSGAVTRLSE